MYIPAIIASIITFLLTPWVIKMAQRFKAMDVPKDDRRVHNKPIPLWGGIAMFLGFYITLFIFSSLPLMKLIGLFVSGLIILSVGMYDDVKPLSAKWKLLIQLIAALVLVKSGFEIQFFTNFFGDSPYIFLGILSVPVSVLWIIGVTNTVNLIDGLDGLAAGISAIAAITLSYIALINHRYDAALMAFILAGSSIGFLPYNFNPAKIFMGDAGSMFLGLILAAVSIEGALKGATVLTVLAPIFALGVPLFDMSFAILRRFFSGRPIMEADKEHIHHRFMSTGIGQKRAVLSIYFVSVLLGFGAVEMLKGNFILSVALIVASGFLVTIPMQKNVMARRKNN